MINPDNDAPNPEKILIEMAKACAEEGSKDVAAVLACAALEDALKQRCEIAGVDVADKDMSEVGRFIQQSILCNEAFCLVYGVR